MLDNIRRKRSQISFDLYKSVLPSLYGFEPRVLKLNLGLLRLDRKAVNSFRYFGQLGPVSSEIYITKNVAFKMLECPVGIFILGHEDQTDNKPRPEIIDISFLLGETEVTQELYEAVKGENPSSFQNKPKNPVEKVSWGDAIKFCNELSKLQGLELCYTENPKSLDYGWDCDFKKNGYRLPKEKEWEYAAKAGTQNKWAGTDIESDLLKCAVYNTSLGIADNSKRHTHAVKTKAPNEWLFYDMSGNVREWCWDKYSLKNPNASASRVARGGDWANDASYLHSSYRDCVSPSESNKKIGFRVCRSIVN